MKATFFHLPEEKRLRILGSAIKEFSEHGFEKGSTDRIITSAGISKGGLYEYIESKTDLFVFTVQYVYDSLYAFIGETLASREEPVSRDLIERVRAVSSVAIDFYLEHPDMIRLMLLVSTLEDHELQSTLEAGFQSRFISVFGTIDENELAYEKKRILDLFKWLLVKTRNEFLKDFDTSKDPVHVRNQYKKNWDFYLDVLRHGVYRSMNGTPGAN